MQTLSHSRRARAAWCAAFPLLGLVVAGCGSSRSSASHDPHVEGRYALHGSSGSERYASIWFSGHGDYRAVLSQCVGACTETGHYTFVDGATKLALVSDGGDEVSLPFALPDATKGPTAAGVTPRAGGDPGDPAKAIASSVASAACAPTTTAPDAPASDATSDGGEGQGGGSTSLLDGDGAVTLLCGLVAGAFDLDGSLFAREGGGPPASPIDLLKSESKDGSCVQARASSLVQASHADVAPPFFATAWANTPSAQPAGAWSASNGRALEGGALGALLNPNNYVSPTYAATTPASGRYASWSLDVPASGAGSTFGVYAYVPGAPSSGRATSAIFRVYPSDSNDTAEATRASVDLNRRPEASVVFKGKTYRFPGWTLLANARLWPGAHVSLDASSGDGALVADAVAAISWGCF